jgi:ABC-type transport system involved in cytochrome c biogenesis permease component
MLAQVLDRIGDWNPQLMRELKIRLNLPNIIIATTISLLSQASPWLIPSRMSNHDTPDWWLRVAEILDREIWLGLAIGGIYLLASDFDREIRKGTIDIVKLTPIQPTEFLIGKLIGVPILIYLAVFLAVPLQLVAMDRTTSIAANTLVVNFMGFSLIGLLYFNAILSIVKFPIPPIVISIMLTAIGWFGLAKECGPFSSRYSLSEWWTESIVIIGLLIVSFVLLTFLQSWYMASDSRHPQGRYLITFWVHQSLLYLYLIFVGFNPLATLVAIVFIMGLGIVVTNQSG